MKCLYIGNRYVVVTKIKKAMYQSKFSTFGKGMNICTVVGIEIYFQINSKKNAAKL